MHYKYRKEDVHYVVIVRKKRGECQEHVFDYDNLMLYLLDVAVDLSDKEIFYYDEIYRIGSVRNVIKGKNSSRHHLNKSELFRQAYEYEAKVLHTKVIGEDGFKKFPDRKWRDCFYDLENRAHYNYRRRGAKPHRYRGWRVPPALWRRMRFDDRLARAADDYDEEDYAPYMTHKTRHKKLDCLGWYDDYCRGPRSSGWKESTKRRHQYKD